MPFDSNGVFSRVMNWTSDQQNGIAIECGRHDAEDDNFAQGFNDCFCRDGRAAATGDFNLGNYKLKNVANGTATTDAVNKGQLDTGLSAKANTSDVVNLTGTQTITGSKTFYSNNRPLIVANPDVESGVTPASDIYTVIRYEDKSGNVMGVCESRQAADGAVDMRFNVWNGSDYSPYAMGLRRYSNGAECGFCPPSDSVGSIVTTEGINKAANGYVKLGNGLIIQWGYSDIDGAQVTLPTPFSNTNYRICATYMKASGNLGSGYGHVITYPTYTTSFYANTEAGMYQWIAIGY